MRSLFLRRVGAYLLDIVLLFAVLAPLGFGIQQALGLQVASAAAIYATLVLNFSLPVWAYFAWADRSLRGATFGKHLCAVRTVTVTGARVGGGRALARTAVKMLPWELSHAAAFLVVPAPGAFGIESWIGLGAAYALTLAYLIAAWWTGGHRSAHDLIAGTRVEASQG